MTTTTTTSHNDGDDDNDVDDDDNNPHPRSSTKQQQQIQSQRKNRVAMIRPVVGKVRTAPYTLPNNDFVYGMGTIPDKEGAGELTRTWEISKPSMSPPGSHKSFPATNRKALRHGCISAKAQSEFSKKNPVMRKKVAESNQLKRRQMSLPSEKNPYSLSSPSGKVTSTSSASPIRVFGCSTEYNDTPISQLLRSPNDESNNNKRNKFIEERDYPDLSNMKRRGKMPVARSTRATRLFEAYTAPPSEKEQQAIKFKEEFKMTKFLNVPSKIKPMMIMKTNTKNTTDKLKINKGNKGREIEEGAEEPK